MVLFQLGQNSVSLNDSRNLNTIKQKPAKNHYTNTTRLLNLQAANLQAIVKILILPHLNKKIYPSPDSQKIQANNIRYQIMRGKNKITSIQL